MIRMRSKRNRGTWTLVALWIAGAGMLALDPARSAAQAPAEVVPRVSLAELNGTPGSSLMLPLYFTPDPKNPVRSITVDIEFVSNNLKFDHASNGTAADQVGAAITTALTEGKPDDYPPGYKTDLMILANTDLHPKFAHLGIRESIIDGLINSTD